MSRVPTIEGEAGAEAHVDVTEHAGQVPHEEDEKAGEARPRASAGQRKAVSSLPRVMSSMSVPGVGTVQGRREKH
jgi:hypothetical protein